MDDEKKEKLFIYSFIAGTVAAVTLSALFIFSELFFWPALVAACTIMSACALVDSFVAQKKVPEWMMRTVCSKDGTESKKSKMSITVTKWVCFTASLFSILFVVFVFG